MTTQQRKNREPFPPLPGTSGTVEKIIEQISQPQNKRMHAVNVPTSNRYEALSDMETDDDDTGSLEEEPRATKKQRVNKPKPLPQLAIHGACSHREITKLLTDSKITGYSIKYTQRGPNIFLKSEEDRKATIECLENQKIPFHTYANKNNKQKSYVLYGLTNETTEDCVREEIGVTHQISFMRLIKMKTRGQPLYILTVDPEKTKAADILKIKAIDSTMVKWEYYISTKQITQCRKCQEWGHGTTHCHAEYKCMKCAGEHATHECKKGDNQPPKCANCGKDHTSNSRTCEKYIERRNWLEKRAAERKQMQMRSQRERYVPAPLPATNPWQARPSAAQQRPPPITAAPTPTAMANPVTAARTSKSNALMNLNNPIGGFHQLQEEISTLNKLININELLQTIKNLNSILLQAQPNERFLLAVEFLANLNSP